MLIVYIHIFFSMMLKNYLALIGRAPSFLNQMMQFTITTFQNSIKNIRTIHTGQQVIVDGEQSMKIHVDSGIPQGTVMGPLLFLLYINDLPGHVTSTVRLFADDCLLYRSIGTPDDQVKLQQDLHALATWATTWGMKFNPSKCHILTTCKNV